MLSADAPGCLQRARCDYAAPNPLCDLGLYRSTQLHYSRWKSAMCPHKDAATISLASGKAKDLQQLHDIASNRCRAYDHLIAGATSRHLAGMQAVARWRCSNSPFTFAGVANKGLTHTCAQCVKMGLTRPPNAKAAITSGSTAHRCHNSAALHSHARVRALGAPITHSIAPFPGLRCCSTRAGNPARGSTHRNSLRQCGYLLRSIILA